jgi:hypothetical protein
LNDLVEMIEGSVDADAAKDKELVDFTSGRIELDFFDVLDHAERLLLVLQKWRMTGVQDTVEILKKEGVGAIEAEIDRDIAAGHLPSWAFFDLAAWEGAAEDSEYGRLLNIQDLPDSARSFIEDRIGESEFQIDPERDGMPDYELYLFMESHTYLDPEEITSHITRLLLKYVSHA